MPSAPNNEFMLDARRNVVNIANICQRNDFGRFTRQSGGYRLCFNRGDSKVGCADFKDDRPELRALHLDKRKFLASFPF